MKKILLLAALTFGMMTAAAQQIAVTMQGGTVLPDGYTFTTNSINAPTGQLPTPNKLRFHVTNLTEEELMVGVKVISMSSNTNGNNVQLCYGVCLYQIQPGYIVTGGEVLAPGATSQSDEDHFISFTAGTDGQPVSYQLAFVRLTTNEDGDFIEQEMLQTLSYTYSATAGTDVAALQQMGISIKNTVVANTAVIMANDAAGMQLFSTTGALVKAGELVSGTNTVDLSSLSAGVYLAKFSAAGKTASARIIKN